MLTSLIISTKFSGYNVERVSDIVLHTTKGIVKSEIKKIKMFSIDAILQPVTTEFTLHIEVINRTGQSVYSRDIIGIHKKTLGLSFTHSKEGEFVEAALTDSLNKLVKDNSFNAALNRL